MDILKKNLGLILAAVVFLLLCVFLSVKLMMNKGRLVEIEDKIRNEGAFFEKVRKSKIRILPDSGVVVNVVQSQKNAEKASEEYSRLCKDLGSRYQINPKLPFTSTEAIRWIRENLEEMAEFAVQHELVIQNLGREFSVILTRGNLASNEFRTVFRMLYVYRRLVEILVKSGVKQVHEIRWPLQFGVYESDRYTVTPIGISISGSGETVQKFLNNMSSDTRMLFYLRTLSILASDSFTPVVGERVQSLSQNDGQKRQEFGYLEKTGFEAETKERRNTSSVKVTDDGKKEEYPEHWVKLDPKRQDWFGFAPVQVVLKARFDLLEFKVDEEGK